MAAIVKDVRDIKRVPLAHVDDVEAELMGAEKFYIAVWDEREFEAKR